MSTGKSFTKVGRGLIRRPVFIAALGCLAAPPLVRGAETEPQRAEDASGCRAVWSRPTPGPFCGDGRIDADESCDEGEDNVAEAKMPGECLADLCRVASCADVLGSCTSTDATTDASTSAPEASSSDASTTAPPPCDDDPACGPGEDVENCPEQCNVCGDGVVYGGEVCDDGAANQTYWPTTPPAGACSEACDEVFSYCGDGLLHGGEVCDTGVVNQTYWPFEPPVGACSKTCDENFSYCGDGVLDTPQEACDDANPEPNTGCSATCKTECIVFVTAEAFQGDLFGADPDELCQAAADAENLFGRYVAWLSFTDASAGERLTACTTPVLRRDGAVVAADWATFVSDTHAAAIDRTEANIAPNIVNTGGVVWTGTHADGSAHMSRCDDWMSVDMSVVGRVGGVGATNAGWTSFALRECNKLAHLYCIQQRT